MVAPSLWAAGSRYDFSPSGGGDIQFPRVVQVRGRIRGPGSTTEQDNDTPNGVVGHRMTPTRTGGDTRVPLRPRCAIPMPERVGDRTAVAHTGGPANHENPGPVEAKSRAGSAGRRTGRVSMLPLLSNAGRASRRQHEKRMQRSSCGECKATPSFHAIELMCGLTPQQVGRITHLRGYLCGEPLSMACSN